MAIDRKLQIILDATDNTGRAMKSMKKGVDSAFDSVINLKNMLITGFAGVAIKQAVDASNQLENALIGLNSVANAFEQDADKAKQAAIDLSKDGLMSVKSAADSLKNLLATGFSLPEAINLMEAFKDSAAFNRQGTLEFGQAIEGATQGIKNQNSIMVDNAGITKNLSVILKEAGFSQQDLGKVTSDTAVRTALYNGILKEASTFQGDAAKMSKTLSGRMAELNTIIFNVKAAIGKELAPTVGEIISKIKLWVASVGGPEGIARKTKELIDRVRKLYDELKPLIFLLIGGGGLLFAYSKVVGAGTLLIKGMQLLGTASLTTTTKVVGLKLALAGLPLAIFITIALVGYTLVMNQIRDMKKAIDDQAESSQKLGDIQKQRILQNRQLMNSEIKELKELGELRHKIDTERLSGINNMTAQERDNARERINILQKEIDENKSLNNAKEQLNSILEKTKQKASAIEMPDWTKAINNNIEGSSKLDEKVDKLKAKFQDFGDKVKSVSDKISSDLKDVVEKISSINKEINSLNVDYAKDTLSVNQEFAQAFVDQEKKVAELKAKWGAEGNQEQKDELFRRLQFEEQELAKHSTIAIAFEKEVNEARRIASLSDIDRAIEGLDKKRTLLNQEFEAKKNELNKELELEIKKQNKLIEIQETAQKQLDKFLAQNEQATVESINREIEYWNKLARAIANAKKGLTSGGVSLTPETINRATQEVAPVNINISGNTFLDEETAEKVGDMVIGKLQLNALM